MPIPAGYTSGQIVQAVPTGINSALVFIKSQTIGSAVASVTVSDAFSTTYDTYKVTISGGASSNAAAQLNITFGATTTGYYYSNFYAPYGAGIVSVGGSNVSALNLFGSGNATSLCLNVDIMNPFTAEHTQVSSSIWYDPTNIGIAMGYLANTTSYTDFTITPNSGTMTGGEIRVYGYTKS